MMEFVGHPVFALTRTAFGPVTLKVGYQEEKEHLEGNTCKHI